MATPYTLGAAALVLGLAGAAPVAHAEEGAQPSQRQESTPQTQQGANPQCPACGQASGAYRGAAGAQGQAGQQQDKGQQPGAGQQPGMGQPGFYAAQDQNRGPVVPQYWLADASLFIGNAANAANVLSMEQGLDVQAPQVLGNQAQFLLAATNRALTSLIALQQSAEAKHPAAVTDIRNAIGQLVAAQAQAAQVADAANAGIVGPSLDTSVRSAAGHLAAAERAMIGVGRSYGAPHFAQVGSCQTRAFGAGLGGVHGPGVSPGSREKQQQPQQQQPQQQTPQQQQQPGGGAKP